MSSEITSLPNPTFRVVSMRPNKKAQISAALVFLLGLVLCGVSIWHDLSDAAFFLMLLCACVTVGCGWSWSYRFPPLTSIYAGIEWLWGIFGFLLCIEIASMGLGYGILNQSHIAHIQWWNTPFAPAGYLALLYVLLAQGRTAGAVAPASTSTDDEPAKVWAEA